MMECGPKILSVQSNGRFQSHLKNAANALCARTLPKQRRSEGPVVSQARHHTYPRTTPPKRAPLTCRMEPILCDQPQPRHYPRRDVTDAHTPTNGVIKPKRTLAREVANAWEGRVGQAHEPAPAARVQSLFNDIELYPTKTQVFEMLVCARQCARRKSLTLTFGEFCVFAAELRRCSKQARLTPTKPESPLWSADKEIRDREAICKTNGSEPSPPPCEVFLGGSCNPTTWRSDIAIPILNKMGITYFNPQVDDWSTELVEVEHRAKAAARALLFVLDSETRAVAACVEAAHLAAAPRDLLLVLRPYARHQVIGRETISDHEYVELSRARATLQEAVERRGLPAFSDIPAALRCARAVLRGARTQPRHSLGHTILRLKRAFDAAGGRNCRLPRSKAVDTLKDVTRSTREAADRCLASGDMVDFETFCAAVAELVVDAEVSPRNGSEDLVPATGGDHELAERTTEVPAANGRVRYNARLKAYGRKLGLFIPKNGGNRTEADSTSANVAVTLGSSDSGDAVFTPGTERRLERLPAMLGAPTHHVYLGGAFPNGGGLTSANVAVTLGSSDSGDAVFTPGTERRLERLPAMLGAPTHHVYLGGAFPSNGPRPEELLRAAGLTYIISRANDYTRMFSTPVRRSAPTHPESPRRDKKPRSELEDGVEMRDKQTAIDAADRLSASDFYKVTEDVTPQPFKGTYDEDLLLGSRTLVFSMSADSPCFAAMVLAAHYMGLRPEATVLIVQPMDASIATSYSECAVKDYNRGRHYLADLARRGSVPVFDNVAAAIQHVVDRHKHS